MDHPSLSPILPIDEIEPTLDVDETRAPWTYVPTYYPTLPELNSIDNLINQLEDNGANKAGAILLRPRIDLMETSTVPTAAYYVDGVRPAAEELPSTVDMNWRLRPLDCYSLIAPNGLCNTWHVMPPQYAYKLEAVAAHLYPKANRNCDNILDHDDVRFSPRLMESEFGLPVNKVVQGPNDFVLIFPHAYFAGPTHLCHMKDVCNMRWVPYGKMLRRCACNPVETEQNDVATIVNIIYGDEPHEQSYELHPEDPLHIKRAYQDAKLLLKSSGQLAQFQACLARKREIPAWFLAEFPQVAGRYEDKVSLLMNCNLPSIVTEEFTEPWFARIRKCKVKLRQLNRPVSNVCGTDAGVIVDNRQTPKDSRIVDLSLAQEPPPSPGFSRAECRQAATMCMVKMVELTEDLEAADAMEDPTPAAKKRCRAAGVANAADSQTEAAGKKTCRHRAKACRSCSGCAAKNCGRCKPCLDMPEFGGERKLKQKCILRKCLNLHAKECEKCMEDKA